MFSAGMPISLARIWAKVVACPWPWLTLPSRAIALPVGCTRISHESNMPMPRMSQFFIGPAPTISVKKLTPIPISLRVSPRAKASRLRFCSSRKPLQRRLQILTGEFEKGARSFRPGIVLKPGTTLVRQWRGHSHTVVVREDGFEYDGQRYRSLSVIAEKITGAHWSGRRFFGVSRPARRLGVPARGL